MAENPVQRRLAAILAADVVGYSRLMGAEYATFHQTGTTNMAHMEENVGAATIAFSVGELSELNTAVSAIRILGDRLPPAVMAMSGVEAPPKQ